MSKMQVTIRKYFIFFLFLLLNCFCLAQSSTGQDKGIKWIDSNFGTLKIKVEPHTQSVMTPNLAMQFKNVFQMLRQHIDWLIPSEVKVEVYQNKPSFLYYNRSVTEDWSGAFFDPGRNIIVMYDEPKRQRHMFKKYAHELTHLFIENTFNPPASKAPRREPPVWLNEGLAVNMEDIAQTPQGDVWNNDLVLINIFSEGQHRALQERKKNGGLTDNEKRAISKFAVTNEIVFFQNFADFMEPDSYDKALQRGKVDDWYLQAYAMVRFLFRPSNSSNSANRMKFKQFTEALYTYVYKKDGNGRFVLSSDGKKIKSRPSEEEALQNVYRFKNIYDFERQFWAWLKKYQAEERKKLS